MFFPVKKYQIHGESMEPTFKDGDIVLACFLSYTFSSPRRGQIVVATHPTEKIPIIKRITDVKSNAYFLSGDNTKKSSNSTSFGWVKRRDIHGKVFYRL